MILACKFKFCMLDNTIYLFSSKLFIFSFFNSYNVDLETLISLNYIAVLFYIFLISSKWASYIWLKTLQIQYEFQKQQSISQISFSKTVFSSYFAGLQHKQKLRNQYEVPTKISDGPVSSVGQSLGRGNYQQRAENPVPSTSSLSQSMPSSSNYQPTSESECDSHYISNTYILINIYIPLKEEKQEVT